MSYSVLDFDFSLFFVSGPCARLSWPSRKLLSARKSTVSYRMYRIVLTCIDLHARVRADLPFRYELTMRCYVGSELTWVRLWDTSTDGPALPSSHQLRSWHVITLRCSRQMASAVRVTACLAVVTCRVKFGQWTHRPHVHSPLRPCTFFFAWWRQHTTRAVAGGAENTGSGMLTRSGVTRSRPKPDHRQTTHHFCQFVAIGISYHKV